MSLAAGAAPEGLPPMDVEKEGGGLELWAASMLEYLLPEHQAIVKKVQAKGLGICSSCRWSSGCHRCSWIKAVRYWRNFETRGAEEGYSSSKPKSKPLAGGGDFGELKLVTVRMAVASISRHFRMKCVGFAGVV